MKKAIQSLLPIVLMICTVFSLLNPAEVEGVSAYVGYAFPHDYLDDVLLDIFPGANGKTNVSALIVLNGGAYGEKEGSLENRAYGLTEPVRAVTALSKLHAFVQPGSVNQPPKVYPVRTGSAGADTFPPSVTVWLVTALPP